jgi:hypothetical protein
MALPVEEEKEEDVKPLGLQPLEEKWLKDLGLYAPFEVSDEDMYGPDELGPDTVAALRKMVDDSCLYENAAWVWEKIQAAEARLFDRGYQWLTNDRTGGAWVIAGTSGSSGIGSGGIKTQDKDKLWSINIYGARKDKIVSALTVKDPEPEFFPKLPESAIDQQYADEAMQYKHLWKQATNVRKLCVKIGGLFYTDDRTALITESIADAQAFGMNGTTPNIREVTKAKGKLEFSVPMSVDEDETLPWCRRARELDSAVAKEKYSWIASKITAGSGGDGKTDRTCRLTVRNAVANQTGFTSNAQDRAVTETTWWVRPSQYRDVVDEPMRKMLRATFPDGMRIVFAGDQFAYCRNEKMDDCVIILYSREGTGQNRRAIGSNNLTTQKVLNYDFRLFNRYMTATVPRKFHRKDKINSEALQQQRDDPGLSTPVDADTGEDINSFTGTEAVPQPPQQLLDFIQLMSDTLPQELDGASPAMFGGTDGTDTVGGITIQRDQALQVFGTPYNAMTWGIAISCGNAAKWAGRNRSGKESGMVPGVGRISVDFSKMANGDAYCFPEADSGFPESEAEKEQRLEKAIEQAPTIPIYMQSLNDPINFEAVNKVTKRFGMKISGTDSVRKQQEEFELILKSPPIPNPALAQAQMQLQQSEAHAATDPQAQVEAQSPDGQQAMQQVQEAVAQIPPFICSVPVEQDDSVNHVIEAAICFDKINSPEGQKLKRAEMLTKKPGPFTNLMLHRQGHMQMAAKLAPPPAMPEVKPGVTVAVDKLGPIAQVAMLLKEYGVTVAPEDVQPTPDVHEIVQEKEGVDGSGVPTKQKISYSGKALQ